MTNKHVVSLEPAKKLKEAGYPQEGRFWWFYDKFDHKWKIKTYPARTKRTGTFVAPLASELMERLPEEIITKHTYSLNIGKWNDRYNVTYNWEEGNDSGSLEGAFQSDNNLCDALALMWLYLKQKGLL